MIDLTESKLSTEERDALPKTSFGLPKERKFPLIDKNHVNMAIRYFHTVTDANDKKILAKNIKKRAKELGMDINKESVWYGYTKAEGLKENVMVDLTESTKSDKVHKCPLCTFKTTNIQDMWGHFDTVHGDMIPGDYEGGARRAYFNLNTGRPIEFNGKCVVCSKSTGFNEATGKYYRYNDDTCIKKARDLFRKNMLKKYNTDTLLNDPAHQRLMLSKRKISGEYIFQDGGVVPYVGSYEHDFLKFLDHVLEMPATEIITDFQAFYYEYEGNRLFYIPDFYLQSLNLIIEIKDGGNNPNNHHKIQAVDKEKEKLKDAAIIADGRFNYIKLTDKNYDEFLVFLARLKNQGPGDNIMIMENHNLPVYPENITGDTLYVIATKNEDGSYENMYLSDNPDFDMIYGYTIDCDDTMTLKLYDVDFFKDKLLDIYVKFGKKPEHLKQVFTNILANKGQKIVEDSVWVSIHSIKDSKEYEPYVKDLIGLDEVRFSSIIKKEIELCIKPLPVIAEGYKLQIPEFLKESISDDSILIENKFLSRRVSRDDQFFNAIVATYKLTDI